MTDQKAFQKIENRISDLLIYQTAIMKLAQRPVLGYFQTLNAFTGEEMKKRIDPYHYRGDGPYPSLQKLELPRIYIQ